MSTNTLTERYVYAVVRRIPADQRDEVAEELRSVIADTVEARGATEHEVLTEMGDPVRLAACYVDRPLALIGPDLYPAYVRTLKVLLVGVLPVLAVLATAAEVFDGGGVAEAVFAFSLIWVLHRQAFFNPDFLAAVNDGKGWEVPEVFYTGTILAVLAVAVSEVINCFREARA